MLPPGPRLAALADEAWEGGLGGLGDDELTGLLRAARRLASRAAALELAVVADLAGRRRARPDRDGPDPGEHVGAEVAAALTLTTSAAARMHDLALGLARLPSVGKALAGGRIDQAKAAVIAAETSALGDVAAAAVATVIVGAASSMTTGQLRAELRRLVIFMDPAAALRRKEAAERHARVEFWREDAGTCALSGRDLPAGLALAADKHVTAAAQYLRARGAEGTLGQLRARAYLGLLCGLRPESLIPANRYHHNTTQPGATQPSAGQPSAGQPSAGQPSAGQPSAGQPGGGGLAAGGLAGQPETKWPALTGSVNLTLPLATWLGWSQTPGDVPGFGPLDATDSRDLAGTLATHPATAWCLTLLDPAAHACAGRKRPPGAARPDQHDAALARWLARLRLIPLTGPCDHTGLKTGYRPSPKLQHLVRIRRPTCTFPGCRQPARRCDIDHTLAYDHGGPTCLCNLGPLCRRHHRCKQAEGWNLSQDTPGEFLWTTPSGRRYSTRSAPYPR